jgi:hypothetical protein
MGKSDFFALESEGKSSPSIRASSLAILSVGLSFSPVFLNAGLVLKPGKTEFVGVVARDIPGNEIDPCGCLEMCCGSEVAR